MTSLRVPGALSGPLAGTSFIAGVAGAVALSESPYPRPGAQPADVRRYFRGSPGAAQLASWSPRSHWYGPPPRWRSWPGGARLARAANGGGLWRHGSRRVAGGFGTVRGGAHR
jgi:hypothetical protein